MHKSSSALLSALVILVGTISEAASPTSTRPVPNVSLKVTVKQKQEGKISKGFHVLHLECDRGRCSLTSLSLNQCWSMGGGKPTFTPTVERTSTEEGNLKVIDLGAVLLVEETSFDLGGRSTTLRFGYVSDSTLATKVSSFSGGFVKNSDIAERVLTVDYTPLVGDRVEISLDCPAVVPGILGGR